jgi:hypothetical protein
MKPNRELEGLEGIYDGKTPLARRAVDPMIRPRIVDWSPPA